MWLRFGDTYYRADVIYKMFIEGDERAGFVVVVPVDGTELHIEFKSEQTASFFIEQIIKAINTKEGEAYIYNGKKTQYVAEPNFAYVDEIYDAVRRECGEVVDV